MGVLILVVLLCVICAVCDKIRKQFQKRTLYQEAQRLATELKLPLVVVGSPSTGSVFTRINSRIFNVNYGCGDVCVDVLGCSPCAQSVEDDLLSYLLKLRDNSCVLFISVVLEYVDLDAVKGQILRVAGKHYCCVTQSKMFPPMYLEENGWLFNKNIVFQTKPVFIYAKLRK